MKFIVPLALLFASCSTHHGSLKEMFVGQSPRCIPACAKDCAILPEGWSMESCCPKDPTFQVPAHIFEGSSFRPRVTHTEPVVEVPTRVFDTTGLRHAPISEVPTVQVPAAVFDDSGIHRKPPVEEIVELSDEPGPEIGVVVPADIFADAVRHRKALEAELERLKKAEAERAKFAPAHPNAQSPIVPEVKCYPPSIPISIVPSKRYPAPPPPPPPPISVPLSRR